MATKDQLRSDILSMEPNNEVAKTESSGHSDLTREWRAAKKRHTANMKANAISATVKYRLEDGESLSWRFARKDTGDFISNLYWGQQLPMVGSVETIDEQTVKVDRHEEGLSITAADLPIRSQFDQRRIYTTPNGSQVVFKRVDSGRVVLWSYKIQGEIALGGHVKVDRTDRTASPTAARQRKMTQKILASYLISQNPFITGKEMTAALKDAFPSASISPRHGPHYLSLSRNQRLPEPPDEDPRTW